MLACLPKQTAQAKPANSSVFLHQPSSATCKALKTLTFGAKKQNTLKEIEHKLKKCFRQEDMQNTTATSYCAKDYISAIEQSGFAVKDIAGIGGESVVFELENGKILKLSPLPYQYDIKGVTLPSLSRGTIILNNKKQSKFYFLMQDKVNIGEIDKKEFELLQAKARKEGCTELSDSILEDGSIKQSNFGWRIQDGKKEFFVIDTGVPKRGPERHFYEELIKAENKVNITEIDFSAHMYNAIWERVTDSKDYTSISQYHKECALIKKEFIELANQPGIKPLAALQQVFKNHGLEPLEEYEI